MSQRQRPKISQLSLPPIDEPTPVRFSTSNAKLRKQRTALFSLPSGYTCPGAKECLSWFDRREQKLKDGPDAKYRCYAASMEAGFKTKRNANDRNLAVLMEAKTAAGMASVLDMSLPSKYYHRIRIHSDGDFFSAAYFLAWIQVATDNPERLFYAYTKSLPFWVKYRSCIPENLVLTASWGGQWDRLIKPNGLRSAIVVYHPDEAEALGLEIDHDDSHARDPRGGDFALLIHGQQKAGSPAAAAQKTMRGQNIQYSYSRKGTPAKVTA